MTKNQFAVLSLLSFASIQSANAQSSVTLYGAIDAGIFYNSNQGGSRSYQFVSSGTSTSKWGLTGTEDIGGGTKVIFKLQSSFSPSNGTVWPSGRVFGEYAWIGLNHDRAGTVKLGRQFDVVGQYLWNFSAAGSWGGGFFAHPYDNDNVWGSFFVNNAVSYQSATFAGLTLGGMYGFSNKAATASGSGFANNRLWGTGLTYDGGRFKAGIVYEQLNNPGNDSPGTMGAVDTDDANFTGRRQHIFGLGLAYDFDKLSLSGNATRTVLSGPTSEWQNPQFTGAPSMSFNNYEVDATYALTPAMILKGAYTYTSARVNGKSPHWNQAGLIVEYALSKSTAVYFDTVYQRVHGDGSEFSHAQINMTTPASGSSQLIAGVGMKHSF